MEDFKDSVTSISLSDHEILTGSVDGYIRVYDMRKGRLTEDCMGAPVTCTSFTSDGQCVLASCLDSSVRLVDKVGLFSWKAMGWVCSTRRSKENFQIIYCLSNAKYSWSFQ